VTPTPFATPADLAARLGVDLTDDEQTRAAALLASSTGLIQAEAKQTITLVEDDTLTRRGTRDTQISLPEKPVISVASVTVNGVALAEGTDWYLDGSDITRMPVFGIIEGVGFDDDLLRRGFGWPGMQVEIVYTHGYDEIPEAVKVICLESVVRVWVNPGSVMRERYGSEQVDYLMQGIPSGPFLTAAEQRTLRRLFGRRVASVTAGP
jgi:hypothetical protein